MRLSDLLDRERIIGEGELIQEADEGPLVQLVVDGDRG
jgi:hypothetical protein